jgi:membrane protease YdiL (CAAX protease family)
VLTAGLFFGLSVGLAIGAYAAGTPAGLLPFVLALGPTVLAVVMAWREGHGALRRMFRSLTIRPPKRIWYLVILVPVLWALATVAAAVALGAPTAGLFDKVFPAILFIPLVVLIPAFAEELAWRGYALPRLMTGVSPLVAALVLALPWTLIHVPLQLPGQFNDGLSFWGLGLSIFSYSVLLTWVYVRTGGSVLMTALVHAGLNGVAPIMGGIEPTMSWAVRNILAAVIAVAIVALGGFRRPIADEPTARDARPADAPQPIA